MQIKFGTIAVIAVAAVAGLASAGILAKSRTGLGQLMSATITSAAISGTEGLGVTGVAWHAPGSEVGGPSIALSEQDWLKLSEDVAPVSYLGPPTPVPNGPADAGQQPL